MPCMCSDPECPSCGRAQGTYREPEDANPYDEEPDDEDEDPGPQDPDDDEPLYEEENN